MLKFLNMSFLGVADREEYIGTVVLAFIATVFGILGSTYLAVDFGFTGSLDWIHSLYYILYAVIVMAVTARRARDVGTSPLWCFATLIPWIGMLFVIVFACLRGKDYHE